MKKLPLLACLLPLAAQALEIEKSNWGQFEFDFEEKPWVEVETLLPPAPKEENLLPFHVSASTEHRFFIDAASIAPGADGVVRYTLVVKASGGAGNVTFEGLRCGSADLKRYAFGRADGTWGKARNPRWEPIGQQTVNRQHRALYHEFLCPRGTPVKSAAEAIDALKRGEHPGASGAAW